MRDLPKPLKLQLLIIAQNEIMFMNLLKILNCHPQPRPQHQIIMEILLLQNQGQGKDTLPSQNGENEDIQQLITIAKV